MKLASLFSGGKDSAYSIYLAKNQGHDIKCLVSILPKSEESHLLHHPNLNWTSLQSESMKIPRLVIDSNSDDVSKEIDSMKKILQKAKHDYGIEGIVHGGIKSNFQKDNFEHLCLGLDLKLVSPLWDLDPIKYMNDLISAKFDFIIVSVSSDGLDDSWLGKKIGLDNLAHLQSLSEKYGFNLNFEGGEAETFVINCPLFSHPIKILEGKKIWDGYRGRFEILDARLDYDAR
jgi:ABC transporter with metal-binding/Fe-S-binding domain ATP-binding protein